VVIPNDKLATNPLIGSNLLVESNEPLYTAFIKTSLGFRYNIFYRSLQIGLQNPIRWGAYGLMGTNVNMPLNEEIKLDVFQPNRVKSRFTFTEIQNQRTSIGLNFGVGLSAHYGKHIGIFVEPTYSQSLTSIVRNMPIETYLYSFGVKMGLSWQFGK